ELRMFLGVAAAGAEELGPPAQPFLARLKALESKVDKGQDPQGVSAACSQLSEEVMAAGEVKRSPSRVPDAALGQQLFQSACVTCHGADAKGNTPVAQTLDPKPRELTSVEGLTPFRVYNTVGLGVTGTSMPAFPTLSDDERWAIAFYLFTLNKPACDHAPPKATLDSLANQSDGQLAQVYGAAEVGCLRAKPSEPDLSQAVSVARAKIDEATEAARKGDGATARKALVDAYLLGLEPAEPLLRARAPELVLQLEQEFLAARHAAEQDPSRLDAETIALHKLLDRVSMTGGARPDFWSVFWVALFILLREGFEASIVIGARLAVLKKMDARAHTRIVHAGWILALAAGTAAFLFGRAVLAGANREWVEGVTALVAVGMLLYAALWLNAKVNIRKFMGELREKMQGALGRESLAGLFVISFSAMFRESFETAIFLQGLTIDSPTGVMWGAAAGLLVLIAFVLFVGRFGYRLPMKTLFSTSTVLLIATAVVLLGKGLHSLQEVGALPLVPFAHFAVPLLGLYADAVSFIPQLVLALGPLLARTFRRKPTPPPVVQSTELPAK
ncbi:MAG: FTR1 family protein, partial [Myxococcaceae bacterium]